MRRILLAACFMTLAGATLTGCKEEKGTASDGAPVTGVKIVTVLAEELPIINALPGRIAPTRLAEVRPRVSGIVVERVFEQGSLVKQGDVLYRIDPAPFQVQVDRAEAMVARAKASLLHAQQSAERQEQLRRSNVASQQAYDDAAAQLAQANADIALAQAGLAEARLNLEYSSVTAPISGRIGRALITEGALVSASGSENMASIQQLDPIYADFTQPVGDLRNLRKALKDGQLMTAADEAQVKLVFDDGAQYPQTGRLLFSEAAVDETTGQVTLRGEFPNREGELLPGMYVRVQVQQGVEKSALAVPQQSVRRDSGGKSSVLVVNADDKIDVRPVTTGRIVGDRFVILQGLKEGDRVVVEGFQKIGPGAAVKAEAWIPPTPVSGKEAAAASNVNGDAASRNDDASAKDL